MTQVPDILTHLPDVLCNTSTGEQFNGSLPDMISNSMNNGTLMHGFHNPAINSGTYSNVYRNPTTFTQPQMPGAVLQPTIPGYRVNSTLPYGQPACRTGPVMCRGMAQYSRPHPPSMNSYNPASSSNMSQRGTPCMQPPINGSFLRGYDHTAAHSLHNSSSWAHIVPGTLPWAQPMGATVHFTGTSNHHNRSTGGASRKRNSNEMVDEFSRDGCQPMKVHITEEKISAGMQELSLKSDILPGRQIKLNTESHSAGLNRRLLMDRNSDFSEQGHMNGANHDIRMSFNTAYMPSTQFETFQEIDDRLHVDEDEEDVNNNEQTDTAQPTFVLAPEVTRRIREAQDILPKAVVEKLTQPSMQVVLWKPRTHFIPQSVDEPTDADCSSSDVNMATNSMSVNKHCVKGSDTSYVWDDEDDTMDL